MQELALYIHWPFCKSKCPYCDFNSHVRESVDQERWKSALLKELETLAHSLPNRKLISIFFGGGTPSLMPAQTVAALIEAAAEHWTFLPDIEITLEANPTSVEAEKFKSFLLAGVNRVSLGVQSLREEELRFLGRNHSGAEALKAVELAASIFPRYSFDLIYARPNQTLSQWEEELKKALSYTHSHLSLYQLTIEENTAFHHDYHKRKRFSLPVDELAADMYALTQTIMENAGLPAYEISNHARPGEESRHNLAYWLGMEYAGIGPGAHGRIMSSPHGGIVSRCATMNIKSPERWLEKVEREGHGTEEMIALNAQERAEEWLMMRLRLPRPIRLDELPKGIRTERLSMLAEHKLITLAEKGESFATTPKGRLLLNQLTMELLV